VLSDGRRFLIADLNGELMPQNGRVYCQQDKHYQKAGNHTETFVH
jgi:hypothetical protein